MAVEVKDMTQPDTTDRTVIDAAGPSPEPHACGPDADPSCCAPITTQPPGYVDSKQTHLRRLRRIEGQTRGLQRMIENDEYCIDVLTQISAVTSALKSVSLLLLEEHLNHCVAHAVQNGGEEAEAKLAEANAAIARLVRS